MIPDHAVAGRPPVLDPLDRPQIKINCYFAKEFKVSRNPMNHYFICQIHLETMTIQVTPRELLRKDGRRLFGQEDLWFPTHHSMLIAAHPSTTNVNHACPEKLTDSLIQPDSYYVNCISINLK